MWLSFLIHINKMKISKIIKFCIRRVIYGKNATPGLYINMLRKIGIEIGEGTIFYDPVHTIVDTQNPKLLKIGKKVLVTSGVKILTHDYSWAVITELYGDCVGGVSPVFIGDNVFIGVNTVILKGTYIGNNIIIGASSVVSGKLKGNSVYAGNPARRIMSIEEFYQKRKAAQQKNILDIANIIGEDDDIWQYLREYSTHIEESPKDVVEDLLKNSGNYDKAYSYYSNDQNKINLAGLLNRKSRL